MIRPATMTHGWFLLKGACRRREQEGGVNDVVVAAPSSGASRHNTLVRETALVFVICAAVACGTGPAGSAGRRARAAAPGRPGRDGRGGPQEPHYPGSLPLPETSIRTQKRELHDRERFCMA